MNLKRGSSQEIVAVLIEENSNIAQLITHELNKEHIFLHTAANLPAFDALMRLHSRIGIVFIDVNATTRDETGREMPLWQIFSARYPQVAPMICFTGSAGSPTDTPVFTAPPETLIVAAPQDFAYLSFAARAYIAMISRNSLIEDAIHGNMLPSLRSSFREFAFDTVFKLLESGAHTGLLITREGARTGLIFSENGLITHAVTGGLFGKEAFHTVFGWKTASFTFYKDVTTQEHSISGELTSLLLEASRCDDEINGLSLKLPLHAHIRKTANYMDLMLHEPVSGAELNLLDLISRYYIVQDLITHSHMSSVAALKMLQKLIDKRLVEFVQNTAMR